MYLKLSQLDMSVGTIIVLPCHVIRHHVRSLRRKYDLVRCSNSGFGIEPSPIAAVVIFAGSSSIAIILL